ncbi:MULTISPECIES: adenylate/guanylate cyclase domain-containing protein [unclassified Ruegeria]|uniref:adenylate/guanylate cyclase domain-containing protein n=1 Tax=unclassified Ruegeria TaxID=2625375 RepID=UPI001488C204|nr:MULTISPECIES: adenylate/guanylate cyclase domain-containing protein [unclassified Ruegeria]NOD36243.1 AAA family ATPase [Ruegeria sp. HKCCD7296]NOE43636.1 AAA family ATPase [Ruegeria sp. HKCCD7319]
MTRVLEAKRISKVLNLAGLTDHLSMFRQEGVDDQLLDDLTDPELRDLGLSVGERKRFRKAQAELKSKDASSRDGVKSEAERRQLTLVFCDLVGSTQLAQRYDPEDLMQIMNLYLDTAIGTLKQHGCHLAYRQGDGIMVYFGYPKAMEDDAERAVRAVLETIEAVQNLDNKFGEKLNLRAGIATGMVVVGIVSSKSLGSEEFLVGETANLASRLQGLAKPGEVIVSSETMRLTQGTFEFEPRGSHDLKGFEDQRKVFCVLKETVSASRFEARTGQSAVKLVARHDDLSTLTQLWSAAQEGAGRMALVGGAAGIGKSRLIKSLSETVGVKPLTLQCTPHLTSLPLHPIINELRRVSGDQSDENIQAAVTGFVQSASRVNETDLPVLLDLAGVDSGAPAEPDPLKKARKSMDVLLRSLASICDRRGTLLLVIEDVHWADATTLDFLDTLAANLAGFPVLMVLSHRPEYEPPEHYLDKAATVDLSPLARTEASELVRRVAEPFSLPVILIRQIIEKADGVPLFIEEITKAVLDQLPADAPINAEVLDALSVPSTLQDSLMSRLDRMENAKPVAQLGSVIGRSFSARMIDAVAQDSMDVDKALLELMAAGVLLATSDEGSATYTFSHALVQDTAYNSLLRDDRQKLHLKIGKALLEKHKAFGNPAPDTIAHHCDLGGLKDEAVAHWFTAGEQALSRLANLPAISAFRAALRNLGSMPATAERDGFELRVQMNILPAYMAIYGWSADQVGETAARAMELAQSLGDGETLFAATFCRWTNFFVGGQMNHAMEMGQALDAMAGMTGDPVANVLTARALSFTHYFRGEFAECERQLDRAFALISPELDMAMMPMTQSSTMASLLAIQGCLLWQQGKFDKAETARLKSIEVSRALNHAPNLVYIMGACCMFLPYAGEWDRMDVTMKEARKIADEEGFLYLHAMQDIYMGLAQAGKGDLADVPEQIEARMNLISKSGGNFTFPQNQIVLSEIMIDHGDLDRAMDRLEAVCAPGWERGETLNKPEYHRVRAKAFAASGKIDAARAEAVQALTLARSIGAIVQEDRARQFLDQLTEKKLNKTK